MPQYGWYNCPDPIRVQVNTLVAGCRELIGDNLIGIYLHGSLAFGCHNSNRSDIDLLLVVEQGLSVAAKRALAEMFLRLEGQPCPLEMSLLTWANLHPWQYPTPFDFHNGDWIAADLVSGAWQGWNDSTHTDPDLAAHITILNQRGLCLFGKPIAEVFPPIPAEHYRDSILQDFDWALERLAERPMYLVLNACRIAAFLQDGLILSKDEGGQWGLRHAPEGVKPIISQALEIYRGNSLETEFAKARVEQFIGWILPKVQALESYFVVAAFIEHEGAVLMVQQQEPNDPFPYWALPGGVVEAQETPIEALAREVQEETGLTIPIKYHDTPLYVLHSIFPNVQYITFVFKVNSFTGEISPDDPDKHILNAQFVPLEEVVPKLIQNPYRFMREPLIAYMQGITLPGSLWFYRQTSQGNEFIDFLAQS